MLAEIVWKLWLEAEAEICSGMQLRMRFRAAEEMAFAEIGRRPRAIMVFVEDLFSACLVVDPASDTMLEDASMLWLIENRLTSFPVASQEAFTRDTIRCSEIGLPLTFFITEACAMKLLESLFVHATRLSCGRQLRTWPAPSRLSIVPSMFSMGSST